MTRPAPDWRALAETIAGELLLPESPGYEALRRPAIARFADTWPAAVVLCATPADVAETLALARSHALPIAVRSGGHSFAGHSSTAGVVIDVTPMRAVEIGGGVATVGAGARLGEVYDALQRHGVTIPAGCGPTVGIAGLTLGGGLGILGRQHGLTSDRLRAAQVVLADGSVVDCDADRHPDLFWALRGAGGCRFGVVTSLSFDTLPAPPAATFRAVWPYEQAAVVVAAWQDWAPAAPDELAASLLVTADGDAGEAPVATVFGALSGTASAASALLAVLLARVGGAPAIDVREHASHREAKRYLAGLGGDEEDERHAFSRSEYFRRALSPEAIAALVAQIAQDRASGESRELDFTPWAGAYNRVPTGATAFAHRAERFLLKQAVVLQPGAAPAAQAWLERSWAAVHPFGSGGVYPNFPEPELDDWAGAYHGPNRERLLRVKARYDPEDRFRASRDA